MVFLQKTTIIISSKLTSSRDVQYRSSGLGRTPGSFQKYKNFSMFVLFLMSSYKLFLYTPVVSGFIIDQEMSSSNGWGLDLTPPPFTPSDLISTYLSFTIYLFMFSLFLILIFNLPLHISSNLYVSTYSQETAKLSLLP